MISFSLADDDIRAAARPSANEADWDHRYGGDQMWSGNPNGTLVNEISGARAGPGPRRRRRRGRRRDLAGRAGLERDRERHLAAGARPRRRRGRAARSARRVPPRRRQRARRVRARQRSTSCRRSTRRSPARPTAAASATCSTRSLPAARCSWSATTSSRCARRSTRTTHSRPFDPDAYVRVDDFAAALADSPEWDIEVHEKRPRPPGRRLRRAPRRRHRAACPEISTSGLTPVRALRRPPAAPCATPTGVPQFRQVELRNAGLVQRPAIRVLAFLSSRAWNSGTPVGGLREWRDCAQA